MFLLTWSIRAWSFFKAHPATISTLISASAVLLGLIYQWIYYTPLNVPIFQYSTMADFVLIGSRSLVMVVIAAFCTVFLFVSFVLFLYGVAIALSHFFIPIAFVSVHFVFANVCKATLFTVYGFQSLFTWLKYAPLANIAKALGALMTSIGFLADSGKRLSEWAVHQRNKYTKDSEDIFKNRDTVSKSLDSFLNAVRSKRVSGTTWLKKLVLVDINNFLNNRKVYRCLAGAMIMVTVALNLGMAWINTGEIRDYVTSQASEPGGSSVPSASPYFGSIVSDIRSFSEVELTLSEKVEHKMQLLQIGGTSNYLFFWRLCEKHSGEALIVPISKISTIRPLETLTNLTSNDKTTCETSNNCVSTEYECCASAFDFLSKTYLSLLNSILTASAHRLDIVNDFRLKLTNDIRLISSDIAGDSRERLIGMITFEEDAVAEAWFTDPEYRNCKANGSAAVCASGQRQEHKAFLDHTFSQIADVLDECGTSKDKSKLQIVGYYSSGSSDRFFQRPEATQMIENSTARESFMECDDGKNGFAQAFNKCVARDRADSVKTILESLVNKDKTDIVLKEPEQLSNQHRTTTFPDWSMPEGVYNRIVGGLNRRVDLILGETPKCVFADEVPQVTAHRRQ